MRLSRLLNLRFTQICADCPRKYTREVLGQEPSSSTDVNSNLSLLEVRESLFSKHRFYEFLGVLRAILLVALALALISEVIFTLFFHLCASVLLNHILI